MHVILSGSVLTYLPWNIFSRVILHVLYCLTRRIMSVERFSDHLFRMLAASLYSRTCTHTTLWLDYAFRSTKFFVLHIWTSRFLGVVVFVISQSAVYVDLEQEAGVFCWTLEAGHIERRQVTIPILQSTYRFLDFYCQSQFFSSQKLGTVSVQRSLLRRLIKKYNTGTN